MTLIFPSFHADCRLQILADFLYVGHAPEAKTPPKFFPSLIGAQSAQHRTLICLLPTGQCEGVLGTIGGQPTSVFVRKHASCLKKRIAHNREC